MAGYRHTRLINRGVVGLAVALLFLPLLSSAQGNDNSLYEVERIPGGSEPLGDFVVGPGKIELEIEPGTSKTVFLSVTNRIDKPHIFKLTTEDAVGSNDPAKTVDLLGGKRGPYTLRDYVSLPVSQLELSTNERARIPVTISVPADAEPGGHYGSVLVNTVAVERGQGNEGQLTSQSPIVARIGTLFFVTVPGEVDREGELKDFSTIPDQSWFSEGPIRFGVLFENTGSVHLAPHGTLSITNILGEEIAYQELDPWFALPESLRFREVVWDSKFLIGRYTATLDVDRGYQNLVDTRIVTFWVMPWQVIAGVFGIILVLVFLTRGFFRRFELRRKSVS